MVYLNKIFDEVLQMLETSKKMAELFAESGISYGELSRITKIPKSALQRYLTGETEKIPLDRVELIASALGSTAQHVLGWGNEKPATISGDGQSAMDAKILALLKLVPEDQKEALYGVFEAVLKAQGLIH